MNLQEYEGRALFEKYGIAVPRGILVSGSRDSGLGKFLQRERSITDFVVKAQLRSGKRSKRGGIDFATREELEATIERMIGKKIGNEEVTAVMVEEKIAVENEYYISLAVDRFHKCPVLIFSFMGGVDIEEIAQQHPEKIVEIFLHNPEESAFNISLDRWEIDSHRAENIKEVARKLWKLFVKEDATLVEINPLIISHEGKFFAADAKITTDENALNRHPEMLDSVLQTKSELEKKAYSAGVEYVELDGDIAVIGNGAGLVMATLDAVYNYGGSPANFCDIGGGATTDMMKKALEMVMKKKSVKGIFINIFGGITHCDEIAKGLVDFLRTKNYVQSMVVRMVGTREKEATKILTDAGILNVQSFDESAKKAAALFSI